MKLFFSTSLRFVLIVGFLIGTASFGMAAKKKTKKKFYELALIVDKPFLRPLAMYAPPKTPLKIWVINPEKNNVVITLKAKKRNEKITLKNGELKFLEHKGLPIGVYRIHVKRQGAKRSYVCQLIIEKKRLDQYNEITLISTASRVLPSTIHAIADKPIFFYTIATASATVKRLMIEEKNISLPFTKGKVTMLEAKAGIGKGTYAIRLMSKTKKNRFQQGHLIAE